VLELARRLAERPPRRSVLLVHFGAEELGLIGSHAFVEHPPVPIEAMTLMVNLDMVGRLNNQRLLVDTRGAPAIRALVDSAIRQTGVRTARGGPGPDRSDHGSFLERGIPTVSLFTDFHSDYHRATDIAALIDGPGMVRVVDVAEAIVRSAASVTPAR
jgi:Zn-dependent M28 family amino/carboxypeptidase